MFFCLSLFYITELVGLTVLECVCPPDSKIKYSVFYLYLCSCIILCVILLYLLCSGKANFYVIHRQ